MRESRACALVCTRWSADCARRRGADAAAGEPARALLERRALEALARWCLRYSPVVAIEPSPGPPAIIIDIAGCARVHRGEAALRQRIMRETSARGISVAIGVGSTPAEALVRACAPGRISDAPIEALRLSPGTVESLHALHVRSIGELRALPRRGLLARYGVEPLQRLEMLEGTRAQPLVPVRDVPPPSASHEPEGAIADSQALLMAVSMLLESLCRDLAARARGAREVALTLSRCGLPPAAVTLRLGMASRSARHLAALVRPRLETLDMGMGIERICVTAVRMGRCACDSDAGGMAPHAVAVRAAGELIDTLCAQFGPDVALRMAPRERHLPEASWRVMPALAAPHAPAARARMASGAVVQAWRPSTLWRLPEPLCVGAAGATSLRWRGQRWSVAQWSGPEVIHARQERLPRRYWRVHLSCGLSLWVREQGEWHVEGAFA